MDFEQRLKAKKLKVTPQRMAILKEIEAYGHICIEELYEKIRIRHPSTSLATVYKNIAILCDSGVLSEVKIPGHKQRYEINQSGHIHVMCEKCGALEDLHIDFSDFKHNCINASGYDLSGLSAVFSGVCPKCGSASKKAIDSLDRNITESEAMIC